MQQELIKENQLTFSEKDQYLRSSQLTHPHYQINYNSGRRVLSTSWTVLKRQLEVGRQVARKLCPKHIIRGVIL